MTGTIRRKFGTFRGLVRLSLAYLEFAAGRLAPFGPHRRGPVQRLVFVCQGNICRSAYGATLATELGLPTASLGLETTTGAPSPPEAVASGRRQGVELADHRAIDWTDFGIQPGDLFLVMEIRQAHEVRRRIGNRTDVLISLLGMWCSPAVPHLHDPFTLSDAYFDTCFIRIREAVENINRSMPLPRGQETTA